MKHFVNTFFKKNNFQTNNSIFLIKLYYCQYYHKILYLLYISEIMSKNINYFKKKIKKGMLLAALIFNNFFNLSNLAFKKVF